MENNFRFRFRLADCTLFLQIACVHLALKKLISLAGVPELNYSKCPGKEFRLRWISEYLANLRLDWEGGKVITEEEFNHWVDLCTPASHLFWGLWAIHQARHSTIQFDYVQ